MSDASSLGSVYGNEEGADIQDDEDIDFYAILNVPRDVSFPNNLQSTKVKFYFGYELVFYPSLW